MEDTIQDAMLKRRLFIRSRSGGFSLIELLTVLVIIAIVSYLALPMISGMKKSGDFNSATESIAALLGQARAAAMANNTYVMVGFEESDVSTPRTQVQTPGGTGRVTVQLFSSIDATLNLNSSNLQAISRPQVFDNLDLPGTITATTGTLPNSAQLRTPTPTPIYIVGKNAYSPTPSNTMPPPIVAGNYTFDVIVAFGPQGEIYLPTTPPIVGPQYIEVDIRPTNGVNPPAVSVNESAIDIDGLMGTVTIFRS